MLLVQERPTGGPISHLREFDTSVLPVDERAELLLQEPHHSRSFKDRCERSLKEEGLTSTFTLSELRAKHAYFQSLIASRTYLTKAQRRILWLLSLRKSTEEIVVDLMKRHPEKVSRECVMLAINVVHDELRAHIHH